MYSAACVKFSFELFFVKILLITMLLYNSCQLGNMCHNQTSKVTSGKGFKIQEPLKAVLDKRIVTVIVKQSKLKLSILKSEGRIQKESKNRDFNSANI